jgi:peptide/nickel transport system substrate-binding protein
VQRKDYSVALNLTGTLTDDPDAMLYENYACGGVGNYNGYCNPEIDRMIEQQSREPDQEKRKHIVWDIERRLVEDNAKPLLYFGRGGICWDPKVRGLTTWSTASTTAGAWKTSGSTNSLYRQRQPVERGPTPKPHIPACH